MTHFTRDALLTSVGDKFQVGFDGIDYLPTDSANATGVLLFGLRPNGIKLDCSQNPHRFMQQPEMAGRAQHLYANRDRVDFRFDVSAADEVLCLIAESTALAPTPETALAAHNLIVENLGPASAHLLR